MSGYKAEMEGHPRSLFIDTSALVALADASDDHHRAAGTFLSRLSPGSRLLTTDYVLDETITFLRFAVGHGATVRFVEALRASRIVQLSSIGESLRDAAWALFCHYDDQAFSFTDCTSFAFMKATGLHEAFAFDRDFARAGFMLLPAV